MKARSSSSKSASTASAAAPVDRDEHRVPAAGPAARRDRALHARVAFRHRGVVVGGDGALLAAERLRRIEPRLRERLRVDAACRRQRVAHARDAGDGRDARGRSPRRRRCRPRHCRCAAARQAFAGERRAAVDAVAEAQHRVAVVLGLDDELGRLRVAGEQVALRVPAPAGRRRCAQSSAGRTSAMSHTQRRAGACRLGRPAPSRRCRRPARALCCVSGATAVRSSG